MILYHGSMVSVEAPRILTRKDGRGADFGAGFYTTSSRDQAVRWIHVLQGKQEKQTSGFVSSYSVPDNLLSLPELKTRVFRGASRVWLHFVRDNRTHPEVDHLYDIVKGPVANDRVYSTLTLWEENFLDEAETIRRLKTFTLVDQILFHTEKALSYLSFLKAEVIE